MPELKIYFETETYTKNDDGSPRYAGASLVVGKAKEPVPYEKLICGLSVEAVLKAFNVDNIINPAKTRFISPEEYNRKYGGQEDVL